MESKVWIIWQDTLHAEKKETDEYEEIVALELLHILDDSFSY